MATLHPFKALRPVRDKVHLVATRPYYSYKKNVLKAKLEDNPFTLLHIINPEFNKPTTPPNSPERFQMVKAGYERFEREGILVRDRERHVYLYRQTTPERSYTGIIAGADAEEYLSDQIKKHEATLTERENVFTQYLDLVGLNAEPVLMSYQGNHLIDLLIERVLRGRPEYEFTTTDLIKHELWIIDAELSLELVHLFTKIEATYIADGHHRSASSVRLYEAYKARGISDKGRYFLAYFVKETELQILAFQRLVRTLNGLSPESFIAKIAALGTCNELLEPRNPRENHEMVIYINEKWYSFRFDGSCIDKSHPTKGLDSDLLTHLILGPLLGIHDLKTSEDIAFIPGNIPQQKVIEQLKNQHFEVAFFLYPITMNEVKKVADNGMYMPPKSTWVEPKLRSGLTIMDLHD